MAKKVKPNKYESCGTHWEIICYNRKDEESGRVLIDLDDYVLCKPYNWYIVKNYVCAHPNGVDPIKIQHTILNHTPSKKIDVDHKNRNSLDNRKSNLRICAHGMNMGNISKHKDNKSGYKGVCWDNQKQKWRTTIQSGGKSYHLGFFSDAKQAGLAYNKKALELFGEYAALNSILIRRTRG